MTEVRNSCNGGKGLFATKPFTKGSLILEELPIVKLSPLSDDEGLSLIDEYLGTSTKKLAESSKIYDESKILTVWETVVPPPSVPRSSFGKFQGMAQAGLWWIRQESTLPLNDKESVVSSLMDLYHPSKEACNSLEESTMTLVEEVIRHLQELVSTSNNKFNDWSTLNRLLLIWAYNSFEGGRIYSQISRINHDCNPNAIVQAEEDKQRILAATDIAVGDEITISYLGLLLYAETSIRKERLRTTKYFECGCQRCKDTDDIAARIPCPTCHPRELPQQSLDEDVQYDDEQAVTYVTLGGSHCTQCKSSASEDNKLQVVMKNVISKVETYLEMVRRNGSNLTFRETFSNNNINNNNKEERDDAEEDTVLEDHLGLANTIMGDRHWTTNLLRLTHLDRRLSLMSQAMLTSQELPDMEDVAEAIDSLQRLDRFVQSLRLQLDGGHVLGDVIIGVARTLVSLGDRKSQKYAAEWLDKISSYVDMFESDGKQKVVAALKVAWTKSEADGPLQKKMKSSS